MGEPLPQDDPFEHTIFQTVVDTPSGERDATDTPPTGEAGLHGTIAAGGYEKTLVATGPRPVPELVPLEGRSIRQFRLIETLGEGGQGVVWLAQDELLEKKVALKFLPLSMSADPQAMELMKKEAQVLLELTHEGIVRLNTLESHGDVAFLVMEFLAGPSLQDIAKARRDRKEGTFSVEEALWVIDQLAPPLDYANRKGITHRDIKPANIMLTDPVEGPLEQSVATAKLCDFGIAFVTTTTMNELTGYVPVGTLGFMAPEVLSGKQPTPAADIYSLAASLYYLIAGRPIFPREGIAGHIRSSVPEPLGSGDDDFDAAIALALDKDPEKRPKSARELLFLASGGRLGRTGAAQKSPLRAMVATAAVVGLIAGGAWIWASVSRAAARVVFDAPAADLRTKEQQVDVSATVEPATVHQLLLGFQGTPVDDFKKLTTEDDGSFTTAVPLPPGEGQHVLQLLDAEQRELGTIAVTVDRQPPRSVRAPRVIGTEPIDLDAGLQVEFYEYDDPVRLRLVDGTELNASWDRTPGVLDVELSEGVGRETTSVVLQVVATDEAGNEAEPLRIPVQVFRKQSLIAHLRDTFPLSSDAGWTSREWLTLKAELDTWRATVQRETRLTSAERDQILRDPELDSLAKALEGFLENAPALTIDGAAPTEGGFELHTNAAAFTLTGSIANPREAAFSVEPEDGEALSGTLERDDTFSIELPLQENREQEVRLVHQDLPNQTLRIVHDSVKPVIRPAVGEGDPLRVADDPFGLALEIEELHPDSVTVDGRAMEQDGDTWRLAGLSLDGAESGTLDVVARDRAGNDSRLTLAVEVDRAPPELLTALPDRDKEHESRQPFVLELGFDEDAEVRSARATLDGAELPQITAADLSAPLPLPDRAGELELTLRVADPLGNEKVHTLAWTIVTSPWGDVPVAKRAGFEVVEENGAPDGERRFPRTIRHRATGLELVYAAGGTFELGSPTSEKDRHEREGPARDVTMTGFYVARTEVSWSHWAKGGGELPDAAEDELDFPAIVGWETAAAWCSTHGLELPTEAQWEYAASGTRNHKFPWGAEWKPEKCNNRESAVLVDFVPVGSIPAGDSWCGAADMAGNAREWCLDSLGRNALEIPGDVDPRGELRAEARIVRGGSKSNPAEACRTAARYIPNPQAVQKFGLRPVWMPLDR